MDYSKVADIICPVLSCKDCNADRINLDPYSQSNAFDELGYSMLRCLRAQGLPASFCVLQDANIFPDIKRKNVKKLFHRYFESEFGTQEFISIEEE